MLSARTPWSVEAIIKFIKNRAMPAIAIRVRVDEAKTPVSHHRADNGFGFALQRVEEGRHGIGQGFKRWWNMA